MDYTFDFLANEAFIRRAAAVGGPFMLKGSYLTRQYFADPSQRTPADLDFTYIGGRLASVAQARAIFDAWMTRVSEVSLADGWTFRSFRENAFWRLIDYAMADDFPTVNTDLACQHTTHASTYPGEGIAIDISFNLPMALSSQPLLYRPVEGAPFLLAHTTPLALQVAWKLHQTLVRPRFKDLLDLPHLLRHPSFTAATRQAALASLADECRADNTNPQRLNYLIAGHLEPLFIKAEDPSNLSLKSLASSFSALFTKTEKAAVPLYVAWNYWRHGQAPDDVRQRYPGMRYYMDQAGAITNPSALPATLPEFEQQLRDAFAQAGFGEELA